LNIISELFAVASTVIFPEDVERVTAASPAVRSSAASALAPGIASHAGAVPVPVDVNTCPSEP
jgi:hypothetical protein